MKIIFSTLFLITSFNAFGLDNINPTPEKVAEQLCSCGQPLVDVVEKHANLANTDPKAFANYKETAAKSVLSCLGGFEYLESQVKGLSYEQKLEFELSIYSTMKTKCPEVGKHFPLK